MEDFRVFLLRLEEVLLDGCHEGSRRARGEHAACRCGEPHAPLYPARGGLVEATGHRLWRWVLRQGRQGPKLHRRACGTLHDAGWARQDRACGGCCQTDEGARVLPQLELPASEVARAGAQDRGDSAGGSRLYILRLLWV